MKRFWSRHLRLLPTLFPLSIGLIITLTGCEGANRPIGPTTLNSRQNDEQPTFSGDGRLLAFVSNRYGGRNILLFDLERQQFLNLPYLNRRDAIAEHPSLSYTGRYIVYLASDQGRPEVELYDRITRRTEILTIGYRGWIRNPTISPNGRYVTFETGGRGQWDIEVLDRGPSVELDSPNFRPIREQPAPPGGP